MNALRSSRKLEKETIRNVEVHWLLGSLTPNYHSIADFRKVNPKALKATFKLFVLFLKDADLITGQVIAMESTSTQCPCCKQGKLELISSYYPRAEMRNKASPASSMR